MATVVSASVLPKPNAALFLHHQSSASPSLLLLRPRRRSQVGLRVSSSVAPPPPSFSLLSDSTRTLSSLLALALSASSIVLSSARRVAERAAAVAAPSAEDLAELRSLRGSLAWAVRPLFFVVRRVERPSGYLNTPLTVVASGMAKWLDIYSGVLMVRVLLSWFPNIPWDRQPTSATHISISSGTSSRPSSIRSMSVLFWLLLSWELWDRS
ncbi:hypothetical protein B296_00058750 [Ensete ventricosum]|uniref:Uncharacterized protein n=1 Tax=Ensete ventricosum TaxID=4639 RepID=A0A426XD41_ENSVE|nr:hypothetical protein B296_00058750 [Ensete ventricosum]